RIYQDIDMDGRYTVGRDKPLREVKVRVDGNRYVVSDENGEYRLDALRTGDHNVSLDLLTVRADLTLLDDAARKTNLRPGTESVLDFRLVRTGRISGRIWLDLNENGKLDDGEAPLGDVRVVTASGRDTLTDAEGNFTLSDVAPGEHVILLDEKTLPEKTRSGFRSFTVLVSPGREFADLNLAVIIIPAEIKRFGSANP
ncbi:MAG: hypothetical protein ABR530_09745, partial [Pyrinomonadaceae bacterium]